MSDNHGSGPEAGVPLRVLGGPEEAARPRPPLPHRQAAMAAAGQQGSGDLPQAGKSAGHQQGISFIDLLVKYLPQIRIFVILSCFSVPQY